MTHATATELLKDFGSLDKVGTSLGSFSVGSTFLALLMGEFKGELDAKEGKLDADPHFWMPMTLDKANYIKGKGTRNARKAKRLDGGTVGGGCAKDVVLGLCAFIHLSHSHRWFEGGVALHSVCSARSHNRPNHQPPHPPFHMFLPPPLSLTHASPFACCVSRLLYVSRVCDGEQ